jgi:hypothetical protein
MLRAGSVTALLNQELAAAGHRTAEVRHSRSSRQGKTRQHQTPSVRCPQYRHSIGSSASAS